MLVIMCLLLTSCNSFTNPDPEGLGAMIGHTYSLNKDKLTTNQKHALKISYQMLEAITAENSPGKEILLETLLTSARNIAKQKGFPPGAIGLAEIGIRKTYKRLGINYSSSNASIKALSRFKKGLDSALKLYR